MINKSISHNYLPNKSHYLAAWVGWFLLWRIIVWLLFRHRVVRRGSKINGLICVFYLIRQLLNRINVIIIEPFIFKSHYFKHLFFLSCNHNAGIDGEEFPRCIDFIKLIRIITAELRGQENALIQEDVRTKE